MTLSWFPQAFTSHARIFVGMESANDRHLYNVTPYMYLTGWAHTPNHPCHALSSDWCQLYWSLTQIFNLQSSITSVSKLTSKGYPNLCYTGTSQELASDGTTSKGFHVIISLRWRHDGRDCVSNHQSRDCLLNRLFGRRSKKASKLRVTGLCAGNSPGTGEFPAQMASNAENDSIW